MRLLLRALVAAAIAAPLTAGAAAAGGGCNTAACEQRVQARALERHYQRIWAAAPDAMRSHLRRIAACESTNNHRAVSRNGKYRGLLQFDYATWATVGGKGDPAAATRWEQWARGVLLYRARGSQPWPVCGRR